MGKTAKLLFCLAIAVVATGLAWAAEPGPANDLHQLPATSGKISYFCEHGCTGAWEEKLGAEGADDAAKYWFVAMRWPYYDPCTGASNSDAKDWWHNRKILVANPVNGKQVVLAVKDWGPCNECIQNCPLPAQRRAIDVSKGAMDALGAQTDDTVNIAFAPEGAALGPYLPVSEKLPESILEALAMIDKEFVMDVFEWPQG